jgi:hypothetical protein
VAPAVGGEEPKPGDSVDDVMTPHRTTPGTFVIHSYRPYHTKTWQLSRIVWGTALKAEGPLRKREVYFRAGGHHPHWRLVRHLVPMATTKWIRWAYATLYKDDTVRYDKDGDGIPDRWLFNDFGPLAVRYFRDTNNDGKLDGDEHLSGEMLHTIQLNEAQNAFPMRQPGRSSGQSHCSLPTGASTSRPRIGTAFGMPGRSIVVRPS